MTEVLSQEEIDALLTAVGAEHDERSMPSSSTLDERVLSSMSQLPPRAVAILGRWLDNQHLEATDVTNLCAILHPALDDIPDWRLQELLFKVPLRVVSAVTRFGSSRCRDRLMSCVSAGRASLIKTECDLLKKMPSDEIRLCFAAIINILGGASSERKFV